VGDEIVRTPWKHGDVVKLYEIWNEKRDAVYVGITRGDLRRRLYAHRNSAKTKNTPLYAAMRKYGVDSFSIRLIAEFQNEKVLLQSERDLIESYRNSNIKVYNILDGGESYFPITDKESWKEKLREKRVGRKPALGLKHTEENKKLFSECGKARWDKYGRYPDDVISLSFKEAKEKYGISKTHYYRLKQLAENNELS
jgi:group I intron endonuclease